MIIKRNGAAPAPEKRNELLNVREVRDAQPFTSVIRADDDEVLEFSGYASTFEPYEMYGGPAKGGWIEQLDRAAFDKSLGAKPDLHLLINHEGMPLARTKSGTLTLSVDDGGLKSYAPLDRSDPDVQRLEPKMRRGDMDEMSFAFRVIKQRWDYAPGFDDDPYGLRIIEEVSLHKGDVSIVNFGANPTTSAELLSAVRMLGDASLRQLAEVEELLRREAAAGRDLIGNGVCERGMASIEMLIRSQRPGNLREAPVHIDLARASGPARPEAKPDNAGRSSLAAPDGPRVDATPAAPADEDRAPEKRGMSLREALARQGMASDDGSVLSLSDALARSNQ